MQKYVLIVSFLLFSQFLLSQTQKNDSIDENDKKEKRVDLTVMPFLSYNRNLEFMFGAIPMAMYRLNKTDTISPKSISGLSAVYTTNSSYFIAFFNRFFFAEDRWRAKFFMLTGDYNSQFFMESEDVTPGFYDYGTKATVVSLGVQRRVLENLYGGLTYTYAYYDTVYEDDVQPPSIVETNAIELNALYDSRSDVYYPMSGEKAKLRFISFPEWFANDSTANKILTEYNKYIPMKNGKDVLAMRFSGQFGLGDIAFQQQVTVGGKDIRGYSQGEFRGDGLMALQGEYRYNFGNKMGLVGFAGLATIYGSDTEANNWGVFPGAGVGYRYQAFKKAKFNIGLDAAVGKSDWGIYFRIGEAF
ncbi:BamA/TamA family outer membrane protein [Galbibacter mesophilus]|uniref:BamA/TamA family outer membrane protein n=1 Tax=Galbibacter mesophilus TaxID=379069 RepID=UPI00191D6307|nr:BamA/TamA family outer membrane protein [Galbibacter mesophilus]MCM5663808.1 BamA/TamA family outer membrane protein [Galbibacter mesophilus]